MIGAFFVLLSEPSKFILCIIVFLAVQYVEEQFIYPHVVGSSVGLSPIWTLLAVLVGGKLFGMIGIFLSIPVTAVIFQLIKEKTNKRLNTIIEQSSEATDNESKSKTENSNTSTH
jgi:predicted PurR-regulated permease PerM